MIKQRGPKNHKLNRKRTISKIEYKLYIYDRRNWIYQPNKYIIGGMEENWDCLPYCLVRTGIGGVVAPSPRCERAASQM